MSTTEYTEQIPVYSPNKPGGGGGTVKAPKQHKTYDKPWQPAALAARITVRTGVRHGP